MKIELGRLKTNKAKTFYLLLVIKNRQFNLKQQYYMHARKLCLLKSRKTDIL